MSVKCRQRILIVWLWDMAKSIILNLEHGKFKKLDTLDIIMYIHVLIQDDGSALCTSSAVLLLSHCAQRGQIFNCIYQ